VSDRERFWLTAASHFALVLDPPLGGESLSEISRANQGHWRSPVNRAASVTVTLAELHLRRRERPADLRQVRDRPSGRAWLQAARVPQWTKNLVVFAAPAAAGIGATAPALGPVIITFVLFCLLATGAYLANDVHDASEDRQHPVKRLRPIASGALAPDHALIVAGLSVLVGLVLAMTVNLQTFIVACAYVLLNAAYTLWLRSIPVAELAVISGGFAIRAIAGAAAAGTPASGSLVAVIAFAALFVAAGKRYADLLDPAARRSRAVLAYYSAKSIRLTITLTCAIAMATYCLWALSKPASGPALAHELTIIPFATALLRYDSIVAAGRGGAPEKILLNDRPLQLIGLAWLLMLLIGT
jgi:decaprenyl-phosphate phosphoribosyltransferase